MLTVDKKLKIMVDILTQINVFCYTCVLIINIYVILS